MKWLLSVISIFFVSSLLLLGKLPLYREQYTVGTAWDRLSSPSPRIVCFLQPQGQENLTYPLVVPVSLPLNF